MTVSAKLNHLAQEGKRTCAPWNQMLATLSQREMRTLAAEVWTSRRRIQDSALKTWLNLVQYTLPTVPGFRRGHYDRLPVSYIAAPLAQFCLRHPTHAARLVACWMPEQKKPLAEILRWCADAGTYFINPSWVDVDRVEQGYVDLAAGDAITESLTKNQVPDADRWRYQLAARWINTYFPLQEARLVENATKVATVLATQQPLTVEQTALIDALPDEVTPLPHNGRHVIPPDKRGGRPRGTSNDDATPMRVPIIREAAFSITACNEGMVWRLYLETSVEDESETIGWRVQQGEQVLSPDPRAPNQWLLQNLEDVQVVLGDRTKTIALRWLNGGLLAFRLSQRDVGRMVSAPSSGAYLLLAPATWTPAMHSYRASEPSHYPGFISFFVNLADQASRITFNTPQAPVEVHSSVARFWSAGDCIEDGNTERPPVYFAAPPKLMAFSADDWDAVSSIVIVEEGRDVDQRRRFTFRPIAARVEQDLDCLGDVQGGWFSARLYDRAEEFIDSITFRFARGLKSLEVRTDGVLPQSGRQVDARVEALYEPGVSVVAPHNLAINSIQADETRLLADLPANVSADANEWRIVLKDGNELPITLRAKRVWWAFSPQAPEASEWNCAVPTLCRNDFRASSKSKLWIKAPPDASVQIGFSWASKLIPFVDSASGLLQIRLGSLNTEAALMDRTVDSSLCVWMGEQTTLVAHVPAEEVAVMPATHVNNVASAVITNGVEDDLLTRPKAIDDDQPFSVVTSEEEAGDEVQETPRRIVSQQIIDYSYIHEIAEDPAYRWFAIQCRHNHEAGFVTLLRSQLDAKAMSSDVPVVVFPQMRETSILGQRSREKYVPLILPGYVFVLMKPETNLQYHLNGLGGHLLPDEVEAEQLEKIIFYQTQELASAPIQQVCVDQVVFIVDGALKGQMGRVRSFDSAKEHARIEVDFVSRTVLVSIPIKQITPA